MANRIGNSYRLAIGKEFAFNSGSTADAGVISFTALSVVASAISGEVVPEALETNFKTGSAMPTACELAQGIRSGQITVSGTLTDGHELLLHAATHDSTSPYTWTAKPTATSFVILRIWDDSATTPYTVDKFSGCRLDSLTITGSSGSLITFDAVFSPAAYTPETSQAITGTDPGVTCGTPFSFGEVEIASSFGSGTSAKSFSIMLGSEYADNASSYQNSNTRLADVVVKYTGELQLAVNYDSSADADYTVEYIASDNFSSSPEKITLANANKTWKFELPIQLTALTKADPDNQLFETSVTAKIVYDLDAATAPSITVAAVPSP